MKNRKIITTVIMCVVFAMIISIIPVGALGQTKNSANGSTISIARTVSLSKNSLTMGVGEQYNLSKGAKSPINQRNFYWYTTNKKIAVVGIDGLVTAKSVGDAKIILKSRSGMSSTCEIQVKRTPKSIKLNKSSLKLGVGEGFDLNSYVNKGAGAAFRTYSSSNENVLKVNNSGKITTKSVGSATVTVSTYNGITASCKVDVYEAPSQIKLSKESLTLGKGETYDLNSSVNSGAAAYVRKYSSTNRDIADVDNSGVVTTKSVGTAIITVQVYNGVSASCVVNVKNEPKTLTLNKTNIILKKGQTFDLDSYVNSGAAAQERKYSTSNSSIATVDSSGVVSAKKDGKAVIRCTIYNGVYAECVVNVASVPERIRTNLDPNKPMVALTFDDGPNSATTSRVLDALEKHGARATFFVVGNRIGGAEARVLKRAYDMGCEIGNHTYSHKYLNQESESTVISEIKKCNEAVYNATGAYPTAFRSPGGNTTSVVEKHVGLPIFYWSIDTRDWETQSASSSYYSVINNVSDGDIVLMHDIYSPSASAAEMMIPRLIEMGYQLVTLHELAYYKGITMKNGVTYYSIR